MLKTLASLPYHHQIHQIKQATPHLFNQASSRKINAFLFVTAPFFTLELGKHLFRTSSAQGLDPLASSLLQAIELCDYPQGYQKFTCLFSYQNQTKVCHPFWGHLVLGLITTFTSLCIPLASG